MSTSKSMYMYSICGCISRYYYIFYIYIYIHTYTICTYITQPNMFVLGQLDHLLTGSVFFQAALTPAAQTEVLGALHPDISDSARNIDDQ